MKDPIAKELFDILACPICKANLKYNDKKTALICTKCHKNYQIKENIPILLP
ncbi:MAG: Trm112 family protein [Candidatus Woesearchaeota archaeon]